MAEALSWIELPFIHVSRALPVPSGTIRGHQPRHDSDLARWCGQTEHVLVTIDTDFREKWVRSGLLIKYGVEVIVFATDVKGLDTQHLEITKRYHRWQADLTRYPYGHRVWEQYLNRSGPDLKSGKKIKTRSRQPRRPSTIEPERRDERSSIAVRE